MASRLFIINGAPALRKAMWRTFGACSTISAAPFSETRDMVDQAGGPPDLRASNFYSFGAATGPREEQIRDRASAIRHTSWLSDTWLRMILSLSSPIVPLLRERTWGLGSIYCDLLRNAYHATRDSTCATTRSAAKYSSASWRAARQ